MKALNVAVCTFQGCVDSVHIFEDEQDLDDFYENWKLELNINDEIDEQCLKDEGTECVKMFEIPVM